MPKIQFNVGVKNGMDGGAESGLLDLYFLDDIEHTQEINWLTCSAGQKNMLQDVIDRVTAARPSVIRINIDSWGGDADLGIGIYNFLKGYAAIKEVNIISKCASIATVIAMAGDKGRIRMPRNGFYVIHQASGGAWGTADDVRKQADVIEKYSAQICDIHAQNNRVGKTPAEIEALIVDGDCWMTGEQAREMGFVDDCYNSELVSVRNCLASARGVFNNIPLRILGLEPQAEPSFFDKINNRIMKLENSIRAFFDRFGEERVAVAATAGMAEMLEGVKNVLRPSLEHFTATLGDELTAELNRRDEQISNALRAVYGAQLGELGERIERLTEEAAHAKGAESQDAKEAGGGQRLVVPRMRVE